MNKWCTEYLVIGYEYSNDRFKNSAVNGHKKMIKEKHYILEILCIVMARKSWIW